MNNSVKELFASYPFLPCTTTDDSVRNIRDAKIVFTMNPGSPDESQQNIDDIKVTLVSIAAQSALFDIDIESYSVHTSVSVPVYTGIDTYPSTASYVIVDKPVSSSLLSHEYRLHPDCLIIMQTPPSLRIQQRYNIDTKFRATTNVVTLNGPELRFADGNNVSVRQDSTGITWYGMQGGGAGAFTSYPYAEFIGRTVVFGEGMRSINGNYGNVAIESSGSSVALSVTHSQGMHTTTVTLGGNI